MMTILCVVEKAFLGNSKHIGEMFWVQLKYYKHVYIWQRYFQSHPYASRLVAYLDSFPFDFLINGRWAAGKKLLN